MEDAVTSNLLQVPHLPTIIAGGRDYRLTAADVARLDLLPISEVISGGARGVDNDGEQWAKDRGLPLRVVLADWDKHPKSAGPLRNIEMAKVAKAAVLFPGGRGTAHMLKTAYEYGLNVYDFTKPDHLNLEPARDTKIDGVLYFNGTPVLMPHVRHWEEMFSETCLYTYDAQMRPTHPIEDVTRHRGHGVRVGTIGAYMIGSGCLNLPGHFSLAVRPTDRLLDLVEAHTIGLQDKTHWRVTETVGGGLNVSFSYGQILGFKFVTLLDGKAAKEAVAYIKRRLDVHL